MKEFEAEINSLRNRAPPLGPDMLKVMRSPKSHQLDLKEAGTPFPSALPSPGRAGLFYKPDQRSR